MSKIPSARLRKIRTWNPGSKNGELIENLKNFSGIGLVDLASNDYLGLSQHPKLIKAALQTMRSEGVGAAGSRLVTGSRPIHTKLEEALSNWLDFERVLLFPSGFQANLAAIQALTNRKTPVIADKLIHYSLLLGIKASGATLKRFTHNSIEDLERLLKSSLEKQPNEQALVITESVFSMQGTSPQLDKMAKICKKYRAMLLVDEAHALGVMGVQGRGLCYGISDKITMISGTFGKAFGSGGAFLATNKLLGEHIIQSSGAFRYTTALAPPLTAAALQALKLIQKNPQWCSQLQEKSISWRSKLLANGWESPPGISPIIPIILGKDEKSLEKQRQLETNGILTIAIRPPTVPEHTARLRVVIRNNLPDDILSKLIRNLKD